MIGIYFSIRVDEVAKLGDAAQTVRVQGQGLARHFLGFAAAGRFVRHRQLAWWRNRRAGCFVAGERKRLAPRCCAPASEEQAGIELQEMERHRRRRKGANVRAGGKAQESLLHRKYVIPFVLACVILACNQATGVNSIIGYNTTILIQGGLSDVQAHWGYLILTLVNFLLTIGGVMLVDRKGRKFLLSLGSAGIIVSLLCVGAHLSPHRNAARGCRGRRAGHGQRRIR